jgi:hypothetical protein
MQVSGITNFNNNIVMNNNKVIVLKDPTTVLESLIAQNTTGVTTITNNNGVLLTTGEGAGLSLTETDTNLGLNIGNGKGRGYIQTTADTQSLILSTSIDDPANSITLRSPSVNMITNAVIIQDTDNKALNISSNIATAYIQGTADTQDMIIQTSLIDPVNMMTLNAPNLTLSTDSLTIKGVTNLINYTLPIAQPNNGDIIVFDNLGVGSFQQPSIAPVNTMVNPYYPDAYTAGQLLIGGGDNNGVYKSNSLNNGLDGLDINSSGNKAQVQLFNSILPSTQYGRLEYNQLGKTVVSSKNDTTFTQNDITIGQTDIAINNNHNNGNINLITTGTGHVVLSGIQYPNAVPSINGQLLSFNTDGTSSFITPTIPNFTYTYWVSNQGNDAYNGTILTPFQTIARALTQANTLAQTDKVIINVMAGTYNEGALSITKNNITINGGTAIPQQTVVNAVITHTIDNTAGASIASGLYGLTVRGVVYAGSSVYDGSYVIGACVIGTTESGIIPFVNSYSLAGLRDITISNCVLNAYDTAGLTTLSGRINATATLFTQVTQFTNTYPVLQATGNGLLALFGCQVYSLNNTNQAPPIISLANTVTPSSSHTFISCTIQYIFNTVNIAPLNKVCIGCTNTVGISMLLYNNLLLGEGTRITNSGAQYVIISKQGTGSLVITYGQNLCGATANHYPTAASRTQLVTATN